MHRKGSQLASLLSPQACLVSCFQQLMVENCSCAYYLYPLPAGAQYCSHIQHPAWGKPLSPLKNAMSIRSAHF